MIVLMQILKYPPDGWEDMRVPQKTDTMPIRGERPRVDTVEGLATQLQAAELEGTYRIVLDDGTVWRVVVKRQDIFPYTITPEAV